jgi:hypothetical protein
MYWYLIISRVEPDMADGRGAYCTVLYLIISRVEPDMADGRGAYCTVLYLIISRVEPDMAGGRAAQLNLVHHLQLHPDHPVDDEAGGGHLLDGEAEVPHQEPAAPRLQRPHRHAPIGRVIARFAYTCTIDSNNFKRVVDPDLDCIG